ncbi:ABC transporter ATP-binding protein [Companilactobacillus sp.]|uniref:ABC transporter ATP-binding protein n=1 Tax=Companilactobacillus sp. TaxID=2767905 RepID=UPI002636A205|nr:ABC transporter ATP-binding protein [Companilactobacillus sp.]
MNAIEVTHVKKSFSTLDVLKGINLQIKQGEIFTLLGENGAGKSTLINILATLSHPDSGKVTILGRDPIKNGNRVRELISLNAQSATVDQEFTGRENLKLIATLRSIDDKQSAIETIAKRLDLTDFLDRKVKTYSGGMVRRLDIAMSLLGNAQIIFLDEPTTGVDPKNRLEIWKLIREIRDSGRTIFLTTQYLDEADALSDHIAFIKDGIIVKQGTPDEIKQRISETYTLEVTSGQERIAQEILERAGISFTNNKNKLVLKKSVADQVIQLLINNGISIQHFNRDETDLQTMFLKLTNKKKEHAND